MRAAGSLGRNHSYSRGPGWFRGFRGIKGGTRTDGFTEIFAEFFSGVIRISFAFFHKGVRRSAGDGPSALLRAKDSFLSVYSLRLLRSSSSLRETGRRQFFSVVPTNHCPFFFAFVPITRRAWFFLPLSLICAVAVVMDQPFFLLPPRTSGNKSASFFPFHPLSQVQGPGRPRDPLTAAGARSRPRRLHVHSSCRAVGPWGWWTHVPGGTLVRGTR